MFVPGEKDVLPENRSEFVKKVTDKLGNSKNKIEILNGEHNNKLITKKPKIVPKTCKLTPSEITKPIPSEIENYKLTNLNSSPKIKLKNLVIVFEPNAARYEFHGFDNRILVGFLQHNYNVLLFNYLGFDSNEFHQFSLKVL